MALNLTSKNFGKQVIMYTHKRDQRWSGRILKAIGVSALVVTSWTSSASAQLANGDFTGFGVAADSTSSQYGASHNGITPTFAANTWTLTGQPANPGIDCVMLSSSPTGYNTAGAGATPMCGTSYGGAAPGSAVNGPAVGGGPLTTVPNNAANSWATLWATPTGTPGSNYHGNVFAADGDGPTFADAISQSISGLTAGASYQLTFWQAAGQQVGWSGALMDWWTVLVNGAGANTSTTCAKGCMNVPSEGQAGWNQVSILFTAIGGSNVISFLASSNDTGANEPPMVLLANVSLAKVPEPASIALLSAGLIGLVGFRRRKAPVA